jgi:hypothetical protein
MKKILAILMVVSVLGMMVGCAPKEETPAEPAATAGAGATPAATPN